MDKLLDKLLEAQVDASISLQEGEEALNKFIDVFIKSVGGGELERKALLQFKGYCISQGRLESLLENSLKNDAKNTQKEE